ncbi:MAG TPA: hypothetical protein VEV42_08110 [Pyrinomonadaceae bacterium]|nr:hypothetical protein [Pyrinomonadaceae bacterium]
MIEPTVLLEGASVEKPQRPARAIACLLLIDPVSLSGDTQRSQAKASGGDAGNVLVTGRQRRAVDTRTIRHETCIGISLFPEITEGALL